MLNQDSQITRWNLARPALRVAILTVLGFFCLAGCSSQNEASPAAPAPTAEVASPYEGKMVKHPSGPGDDGKVYIVQGGKKRWVINAAWFAAHGYKFPDDVREIPVTELDLIPAGDPIN